MKKHVILFLVFEFLAIGLMLRSILNVVTDEKAL